MVTIFKNLLSLFSATKQMPVTIEDQLDKLSKLGIETNKDITIDNFIYSFDRQEYENKPYDLILFVLGIEVEQEPYDRLFSNQVWNFDAECVEGEGTYTNIVQRLCLLAGQDNLITNIQEKLDLQAREGQLAYTVGNQQKRLNIQVNDDWVDDAIIRNVMADIEHSNKKFWQIDNGQAQILFYLDDKTAKALSELSPEKITVCV